ncbi:hypothetical protein CC1G_03160 [Coprinopsis cinerea okayama7|uniref:DUF6534 domain-containing protein n=1 Tax=Coprinopsis cinerea (strain Okayama-7 / 130 / ATCC MYA-4618 / FGSC 9003) TaxID=240176 RepID=A8PF54_COPC7|nr:hypothetical protein CC1G_03160 [Coprinopsis cinerea okayama7\|eukprot:XP_001840931.2 hypothetical protein CC1G_03160 [Coprinopsis cinerea okayama7\
MSVAFVPNYGRLYGPQLIALVITSALWGVGALMTLHYFRTKAERDPLYYRVFIGLITIAATIQICFTGYQSYHDFIDEYDNTSLFGDIVFSIPGRYLCVYITTFLAQIFFTVRIFTLTHHLKSPLRWATVPVLALALLQFIAGCIQVHLQVISKDFQELGSRASLNKPITAVQGAATAACDVVITLTLCAIYLKYSQVSARVFTFFEKIIIFALNRAAATTLCAILSVSLYYTQNGTYRFIIPCLMTGPLYFISAVSVLLTDESLRGETDKEESIDEKGLTKETQSERSV